MNKHFVLLLLPVVVWSMPQSVGAGEQELWAGPRPNHRYNIPDPSPGVFVGPDWLFVQEADTFRYDDNLPFDAWAWDKAGNGWGLKFISPAESITLTGILAHFYLGWPVPGGNRAQFKVLAADGPGGTPGREMWSSPIVNITRGQWNYVPVGFPMMGKAYYIFYVQADPFPACPGFSIDAANNAPSHRKWVYSATDACSEDSRRGEWLIRSVIGWSPQSVNAAALYFGTDMPPDTAPNIDLPVSTVVKNLGTDPIPAGTPVRLRVTGPQGYLYESMMPLAVTLNRGQSANVSFTPVWRIPALQGSYRISSWVETVGEQWPLDDTISYDLSVANWIQYANYDRPSWLIYRGDERATKFNPAHFGLQYPVSLYRARHQFYYDPRYPWPDSTFRFKVYAADGQTLLYQSAPLEAVPGAPGPSVTADFDSALVVTDEFYVSIDPVSPSGHPSSVADDSSDGRSFWGSAGSWTRETYGEYLTSVACRGAIGIAETARPALPEFQVRGRPNPVSRFLAVDWRVPAKQVLNVGLYDAVGRPVREMRLTGEGQSGTAVIDVRYVPAGVYVLRLQTESGAASQKLVLRP